MNTISRPVLSVICAVLVTALTGCESKKERAYVTQLEGEVKAYAGQLDSLNGVVGGYTSKIQELQTRLDTARTAEETVVASLQKTTTALNRYRSLHSEQEQLVAELRKELQLLRADNERSDRRVRQLRARADSLDDQLYTQRSRVDRLQSLLWASVRREAEAAKAITSVFVYAGKQGDLENAAYLKVKQTTILTDAFSLVGYPDVKGTQVKRATIGGSLVVGSVKGKAIQV